MHKYSSNALLSMEPKIQNEHQKILEKKTVAVMLIIPRKNCPRLLYWMQSSKVGFSSSSKSNHWCCAVVKEVPFCANRWKPFWVLENSWFLTYPFRSKSSPECPHRFRRVIGGIAFSRGKKRYFYETKR